MHEKVTGDGVAKLAQLKSLEQLTVDTERATISAISKLNSLSNLTYLDVDNVVQDNSTLNISGLAKLVKLTLRGDDEWRDEDLACLANLKDLKYLQGISGFGDAGMAHLKNLVNMDAPLDRRDKCNRQRIVIFIQYEEAGLFGH